MLFVEGTVEDPCLGAHEAFLDEIVDVADEVAGGARGIKTLVASNPGASIACRSHFDVRERQGIGSGAAERDDTGHRFGEE